jgi:hypothetical protein
MPSDVIEPQDGFGLVRSFLRHTQFVRLALSRVQNALACRGIVHDLSKLLDDEFTGFSRINAHARVHKFGSPEYAAGMQQERETINRHFMRNSHHPEYALPELGHQPMTFLDVIEMVCDWWGAARGYDDSRSWRETVALNLEHKGKYLSPEQRWLAEEVAAFLEKDGDA